MGIDVSMHRYIVEGSPDCSGLAKSGVVMVEVEVEALVVAEFVAAAAVAAVVEEGVAVAVYTGLGSWEVVEEEVDMAMSVG